MDQTFQAQLNKVLMTEIFLCISAVPPLFQGCMAMLSQDWRHWDFHMVTSEVFTAVLCKPCHQVWLCWKQHYPGHTGAAAFPEQGLCKGGVKSALQHSHISQQSSRVWVSTREKGIKLGAFQGVFADCNKTRLKRWERFSPSPTSPANHHLTN